MLSLILIDGEVRSLIRNSLERLIGHKLGSKKDKMKNILFKLSIRVISSLIAIKLFSIVKENESFKKNISYLLIFAFIHLAYYD